MKVAVIGKGTSSIITTLVLLKDGHDITIFYDPNTPHINVGESTTPHISELIFSTLGLSIHDFVDIGLFSYKMGINFVNWGKGTQFHHNFAGCRFAHHFETQPFNIFINQYLEENKIVTYFAERVNEYKILEDEVIVNEKSFDFVVNCSGWEEESQYYTPIFSSVNSAVLFKEKLEYEMTHTLHLATEDGWQFGLPFPKQNTFKCGYLFDKNLIDEKNVKKKIKQESYADFSWKPRYAKELIQHPRLALNGNRLFFLEPLQALSLYYTYQFAELISVYLKDFKKETMHKINQKYLHEMWTYQLSIAYHYNFNSIYKDSSMFWKNIKEKSKNFLDKTLNGNEEIFIKNLKTDMLCHTEYSKIGIFSSDDHQQIYCGMKNISLSDL